MVSEMGGRRVRAWMWGLQISESSGDEDVDVQKEELIVILRDVEAKPRESDKGV